MRADAAANRDRILRAAEEVFSERGVEASTEEVARRAEVGIGTVFRHFPTKRDLVEATLVAHFEGLARTVVGMQERSDAALPTLTVLLSDTAERGATKLGMAGFLSDEGELPEAVRMASDALRAAVDGVLRRAQQEGSVRRDVSVAEVYYLLRGLAQARATTAADPAVRRRAVEVVVAGLATRT